MFLARLLVENFRGFRTLDLRLDPTTVLFGENAYGKSSVLDVLRICLAPGSDPPVLAFGPHDLRRSRRDPQARNLLRVRLEFHEQRPGAWDGLKSPLVTGGGRRRGEPRRLVMWATAEHDGDGLRTQFGFEDGAGRAVGAASDPESLAEIRRLAPFLLVRLVRPLPTGAANLDRIPASGSVDDERVRRLEAVYRELMNSRVPLSSQQLRLAADTAERLLARAAESLDPDTRRRSALLDDVVQAPRAAGSTGRPDMGHGTGLQAIAWVILAGAVLTAVGEAPDRLGGSVLVGIEEPESHLHPRTLSVLWGLIDTFPHQKIVTTNSDELLAAVPLRSLRRLQPRDGSMQIFQTGEGLTPNELRRIGYHIRLRRGDVLFARCWILVEGESEFWLLPGLARQCGIDLAAEGVHCVEIAQCGLEPLVKLADDLGIEWHLLVDGDLAGQWYAATARGLLHGRPEPARITALEDRDIEHCLWRHGYDAVYRQLAGEPASPSGAGRPRPSRVRPDVLIQRAIRGHSKPYLALAVSEAAGAPGSPGVPAPLGAVIETAVRLARRA